jgi:hypothetical protein
MFIVRVYRARLVTRTNVRHWFRCPGLCRRIRVHADRSFVIGTERHELQTQLPPSGIELRNGPQFRLPSLHNVLITSAARNPIDTIATRINGQSATTQKEILQYGFSGIGFLFTSFSQAFIGGHLTKSEMFSANALGALHNCCAIDARLRLRLYCSLRENQTRRSSQSKL